MKYKLLHAQCLVTKTLLVEHVVGLIEDEDFDGSRIEDSFADEILHLAGSTNDNMLADLWLVLSLGDGVGSGDIGKLAHLLDDAHDLPSKLANGSETDCQWVRQREVSSLAKSADVLEPRVCWCRYD